MVRGEESDVYLIHMCRSTLSCRRSMLAFRTLPQSKRWLWWSWGNSLARMFTRMPLRGGYVMVWGGEGEETFKGGGGIMLMTYVWKGELESNNASACRSVRSVRKTFSFLSQGSSNV